MENKSNINRKKEESDLNILAHKIVKEVTKVVKEAKKEKSESKKKDEDKSEK